MGPKQKEITNGSIVQGAGGWMNTISFARFIIMLGNVIDLPGYLRPPWGRERKLGEGQQALRGGYGREQCAKGLWILDTFAQKKRNAYLHLTYFLSSRRSTQWTDKTSLVSTVVNSPPCDNGGYVSYTQ